MDTASAGQGILLVYQVYQVYHVDVYLSGIGIHHEEINSKLDHVPQS